MDNGVGNSGSIGVEPVTQDTPPWNLVTCTAQCVVSQAEQSITIFTDIIQGHKTIVLVCSTIEREPETLTCIREGRENMQCHRTEGLVSSCCRKSLDDSCMCSNWMYISNA